MTPLHITRAGLLGTLAALLVAVVCVRLGLWQLDRLEERRDRNARIAARMDAQPLRPDRLPTDTAGTLWRRADLAGHWDHARSFVLAGRSRRGMPGVHIYTPLRLGEGAILVNRGWVPAADASTADLAAHRPPPDGSAIRALLLPLPDVPARGTGIDARIDSGEDDDEGFRRNWYRLDAASLAAEFPYPLAPVYAQVLPGGRTGELPLPVDPPALDQGSHLGYAVQWFSFAAIALIGWSILALRKGEIARGAG